MSLFWNMLLSGTAGGEVITLSGSSGSPNTVTDIDTHPSAAEASWHFLTDGTVNFERQGVGTDQFRAGVEWSSAQPTPAQDYWIRFTLDSGNAPDEVNGGSGSLGVWYALSGVGEANRSVKWIQVGNGTDEGVVKVEISTDSGGSTIVATGYYKGSAEVTF